MDSYLEIARKVLGEARQPLSARQILKSAYQLQIVPRDLYGRTQHKTLQARLSTDILNRRLKSDFCRLGPGRFFLRSLIGDASLPDRYRLEYTAPLRAAQLGRFDVVAFSRKDVARLAPGDQSCLIIDQLMSRPWRYARLDEVRRNVQLLPFQFLVVVVDDDRVVLNHRSPWRDGDLAGLVRVGLHGVVRREDRSLFSSDGYGLAEAAVRTLMHHLDLPRMLVCALEEASRWSAPIAIYEEGEEPTTNDLIAILAFRCSGLQEVVEAVDASANSEWHNLPLRFNDLARFDRWSSKLIQNPSLQQTVCS